MGITGQAGAGKTNHVSPLAISIVQDMGFSYARLSLDAFFILSSSDRKEWIREGKVISDDEGIFRENQINWWNFKNAQTALNMLSDGKPLHLHNCYNRHDNGELTGEIHIVPPAEGMLIVFEGVAICHLDGMRDLMFVYASPSVRFERLRQRDKHRHGQEVEQRFKLTQSFERKYFLEHWDRISLFVDNSIDSPRVLNPINCIHALSDQGLTL